MSRREALTRVVHHERQDQLNRGTDLAPSKPLSDSIQKPLPLLYREEFYISCTATIRTPSWPLGPLSRWRGRLFAF